MDLPTPVPPNRNLVGCNDGDLVFGIPPHRVTPRHAVELAAWLVALAETLDPAVDFDAARAAVRST